MNELCRSYYPHLPLYAEGELKDSAVEESIRVHLAHCEECRDWLGEYHDLTGEITREFFSLDDHSEPWRESLGMGSKESQRLERILKEVRRLAPPTRPSRVKPWGKVAAAMLVVAVTVFMATALWNQTEKPPGGVKRMVMPRPEEAVVLRVRSDPEYEWVRWLLWADTPTARRRELPPGEVQLVGFRHRFRRDPQAGWVEIQQTDDPRPWVLQATIGEGLGEPWRDEWSYLIGTSLPTGPTEVGIPVHRLRVQGLSSSEVLRFEREGGDGTRRYFRIVGPARGRTLLIPPPLKRDAMGGALEKIRWDESKRALEEAIPRQF